MNVSIAQAASAMTANARWQEVVTENLACSSIPGYKRQNVSIQSFPSVLGANASNATLLQAKTTTCFRPGEARFTGVNTDVAIDGAGFFEVQMPNGSNAYTKDGEFQVSAHGQLVTKQGYLVLGEAGPIQLDRTNSAPITISATGEVSQGTDLKGKLKITEFNDPNLLRPINGSLFLADNGGLTPNQVQQPSLRQGYVESANTSSVMEMANLMRLMRGFEANQKVLQAHDDRMGRTISELGNPN